MSRRPHAKGPYDNGSPEKVQGDYARRSADSVKKYKEHTGRSSHRAKEPAHGMARWREFDTETCMFCLGNERCVKLRMHTIISCGETVWFASQTQPDLINCFHALICPEAHISHIGQMTEAMWQEIRDVKKCYRLMVMQSAEEVKEARKIWEVPPSDKSSDEEDKLTERILAEHHSRQHLTPYYQPISETHKDQVPAQQREQVLVPIFFEFHLPRISAFNQIDVEWKQRLHQGGHYTVDCMIVTDDEAEALKSALVSEFGMLSQDAALMKNSSDQTREDRSRIFRKLESRSFYKKELPHPTSPPPYLYVDFGLTDAYLFILAPGDMTKKNVIELIKTHARTKMPEHLNYSEYLESFRKLYSNYDCFKPVS